MRPFSRPFRSALPVLWIVIVVATWGAAPGRADALMPVFDGSSWFWQNPRPAGWALYDFEQAGDTAWAVGRGGTVLSTTDGGATWLRRSAGSRATLTDARFVDPHTGWVVGDPQAVLHTTDGGVTWVRQPLPGEVAAKGVDFTDDRHGCVVGEDGAAFTTDGGVTWSSATLEVDPRTRLNDVDLVGPAGWAVGITVDGDGHPRGVVLATSDGGATWSRGSLVNSRPIARVGFCSPSHGFAIEGSSSSTYRLIETTDGGTTWAVRGSPQGHMLWVDPPATVIVAGGSQLARSTDAGATWVRSTLPGELSAPWLLLCLSFAGDGTGWAGGSYGEMWDTTDWGATWHRAITGLRVGPTEAAFGAGDTVWAAGGGDIVRTTDAGAHWSRVYGRTEDTGSQGIFGIAARGADRAWVIGGGATSEEYESRVLITTDGGITWTERTVPAGHPRAIEFADAATGWIGRTPGFAETPMTPSILRTTDGGLTWDLQETPAGASVVDIESVSALEAWAVGAPGLWAGAPLALHTTDGGAAWQSVAVPTIRELTAVEFSDARTGWIGGYDTLLRTTDGGASWASVETDVEWDDVYSIASIGTREAYVVVRRRFTGALTLLHTTDGGATWVAEADWPHAVALAAAPDGRCWAVGGPSIVANFDLPDADVTPPVTDDDADGRWHRRDVTVRLTATDAGSGVATTSFRVDGDVWAAGDRVVIAAPSDHSADGSHTIEYYSVDKAGNIEAPRVCIVRIDTRPPWLRFVEPPAGTRSQRAVVDVAAGDYGFSSRLRVRLRVLKPLSGGRSREVLAQTLTLPADGSVQQVVLGRVLPRGPYRIVAKATDRAGNVQPYAAVARLVIR